MTRGKEKGDNSMNLLVLRYWITLLCLLTGICFAGLYGKITKPIFKVTSSIVVYRSQIEPPELVPEDSKNRWVWVRDGLAAKEAILADSVLLSIAQADPVLKTRLDRMQKDAKKNAFRSEEDLQLQFVHELRKKISIDYTGGDVYSYIFTVKDEDPEMAKRLSKNLMEEYRKIAIDKTKKAYETSLAQLKKKKEDLEGLTLRTLSSNEHASEKKAVAARSASDELVYVRNMYQKLMTAQLLFQAEAGERIVILQNPYIPESPVWPDYKLLLLAGGLFGLTIGVSIEFGRKRLTFINIKRQMMA